jgi:ABC-type uncharacterized transport system permease subunit
MSDRFLDTAEREPAPYGTETMGFFEQLRPAAKWAFLIVFGLVALSVVQWVTGTGELTTRGTVGAALRLAIPIMLAGLGGLFSERAGVVNIGLEGMMIAGTWFGAWAAWSYNPWWGVVAGLLGGALFGLIHAVATVTFAVDHIVSGVAINLLAAGGMRFMSQLTYEAGSGGGVTQSPTFTGGLVILGIERVDIPLLSDAFIWLENREVFFISDVSGLLAGFTTNLSWLTLIAIGIVPLTWFLLWRTAWGLRLRSCGENPYAAESLGVPVLRMKYYGVAISGALAGLGGAYLVIVQAGIYREAQTAGRGFIGLAALIFGNWYPLGVAAGASLFGYADALRLRQAEAVEALLLLTAIGLGALALWYFYRRKLTNGAVYAGFAVAFLLWWAFGSVPTPVQNMTPYLVTLLVLSLATQRLRMPAADGLRYRKGEAI